MIWKTTSTPKLWLKFPAAAICLKTMCCLWRYREQAPIGEYETALKPFFLSKQPFSRKLSGFFP